MKLKSFGCSFVYGSDLSDQHFTRDYNQDHSKLTWPALIAQTLDMPYECYAWPGIGNFKIMCDVIGQASLNDPSIFLINWTWMDRFDFVDDQEQWQTVTPGQNCERSRTYYRHFHSDIKDMMSSVYNIYTAITTLRQRHIPFVMTYMDYNILSPLDPNWHDPRYLSVPQQSIKPFLTDFEHQNFLDWSRQNNFSVSEGWHPLEEAHAAAAAYMMPAIDAILHKA
jgi:hypothetical protein